MGWNNLASLEFFVAMCRLAGWASRIPFMVPKLDIFGQKTASLIETLRFDIVCLSHDAHVLHPLCQKPSQRSQRQRNPRSVPLKILVDTQQPDASAGLAPV